MQATPAHIYDFGDFRLDAAKRLLRRRDGARVPLTPKVFDTLLYMVEHHGVVLDKERLMEAVWPDSIVEENNLSQNISTLRHIFGETPDSHHFIVTVPGRGYRFVADVRTADESPAREDIPPGAVQLQQRSAEGDLVAPVAQPPPSTALFRRGRAALTAAAVIVLGASAFLFWHSRTQNSANATPEKSIAVLPFENLSDDKQNAYFAAAVEDEILSNLAKIADLKVISRTSSNLYKTGNPRNSREIGQQLGVAHLLEGNVQRAGERVRLNAQLIDARTDAHVWAQTYDRDLADVFAIQSEIAQAIADQLKAKISPREKAAIAQPPTTDLVANALYQQARAVELKELIGSQKLVEAVSLLDEAVARDPQFVLAYCSLGRVHTSLFYGGFDHTPARRELAHAALQNAFRLQPESGEVHLAWAYYAYYGFLDYDRARAELDLARRTIPNDTEVYYLTALIDRRQSRWSEATRNAEHAVELDPRNFEHVLVMASIYEAERRYPDCRRLLERALDIQPRDLSARTLRAYVPFEEQADIRPLRAELSAVLPEEFKTAGWFVNDLLRCALAERDQAAAARALAAIPAEGIESSSSNLTYPREWFAGLAARTFDDSATARISFTAARATVEKLVLAQPDNAQAWSLLGRIDAALGRKDDALREGRRACELVPLSKDALEGAELITDLAIVYAWTGEKDLALEQLTISAQVPQGVYYGGLKLDPQWDSLRADPRFEKIVASLAPRDQ